MSDVELIDGIDRLAYAFLPQHALMAEGFGRREGPNIGARGENLTIMFLSMDRVWMSRRLCESIVRHIPDFAGEVLAIDNGSQPDELAELEVMLAALPLRTRLVKMGENFGVAGGRNRGLEHVVTEWVMSIDNDIYFVTDPLKHWQNEIASLGCRFFSLALYDPGLETVFLRGGNMYVSFSDGEVLLGGGSAGRSNDSRQLAGRPFLGTCMMGGASIFDAALFRRLGGFDGNMFVGFEDVEFSLRLFREGYKVGCSALAALVHDHAKPESAVDKAYEQVRFRRNYIEESAAYFEKKHGFKVWNASVDSWLRERERELGLNAQASATDGPGTLSRTPSVEGRKRILLVPDTADWAFSNIARQISRHLGDRYDISVVATHEIGNFGQIPLLARGMDLVHVFWRPALATFFNGDSQGYARAVGFSQVQDYFNLMLGTRVTTAVYDHLFLEAEGIAQYRRILGEFVDGYYTSSARLDAIYRDTYRTAPPHPPIPDGVDLGMFSPARLERFDDVDRPLVVGWVGNSQWAADQEDFKGLHSIITPALDQLAAEGFELERLYADRAVAFVPHREMPAYYGKIDVLLCASKIEGTPNPLLEAMACGVPVIITDVGIAPEALGPVGRSFILPERSIAAMKQAIARLHRERGLLRALSEENLEQVKSWDWKERVKRFADFFDQVLARPPRQKNASVFEQGGNS